MRRARMLPHRLAVVALLVVGLVLSGGGVIAQSDDDADCRSGFVCVEYQGETLEIDTRYGAVCVVTRTVLSRTETFAGISETKEAYCTEFEEAGDTYVPEDHEQRLTPEQAAVADRGDFLVDRFAEAQD